MEPIYEKPYGEPHIDAAEIISSFLQFEKRKELVDDAILKFRSISDSSIILGKPFLAYFILISFPKENKSYEIIEITEFCDKLFILIFSLKEKLVPDESIEIKTLINFEIFFNEVFGDLSPSLFDQELFKKILDMYSDSEVVFRRVEEAKIRKGKEEMSLKAKEFEHRFDDYKPEIPKPKVEQHVKTTEKEKTQENVNKLGLKLG